MFQQPCDWITNTNKLKRAGFNEMKLVCRSLSRVTGCEANSSLMTIEHGYGGHLGPVCDAATACRVSRGCADRGGMERLLATPTVRLIVCAACF